MRAYQSLLKSILINKAYDHDARRNRKKCKVFQCKCADTQSDLSLLSAYRYFFLYDSYYKLMRKQTQHICVPFAQADQRPCI